MKLCIHCVHFLDHPDSKDPKFGLCEASPKTYSPVTGQVERDHEFCSSYRISTCGMKARFFEPILGLDVDNETPDAQVKWDASAPLVVTPHPAFAKREWVGLTDEEVMSAAYRAGFDIHEDYDTPDADPNELHWWSPDYERCDDTLFKLRDLIEAKLKEKNT